MGKKIKLFALAVLVAIVAYIYPTAKVKYVKHIKPRVETSIFLARKVANLKVLGRPVPWKFILPVVGVLLTLLYVRRRKKKLQKLKEAEEKRKAELAAQYKALGGEILSPDQDRQPQTIDPALKTTPTATATPSSAATPTKAAPTVTVTPSTPVSGPPSQDSEIRRRIESFVDWSSTCTVNVFALARAGFCYTGRGDVVECAQCKGTLKEWEQDDEPLTYHKKYYPTCPFVKQRESEVEIEKMSCRKRIEDLLTASASVVTKLKDIQQMKLSGNTAQKHLADLQKRLDTTERTMHLVMKQMEAVTKCLARTLDNDASDAKEINDGLQVMKESNV